MTARLVHRGPDDEGLWSAHGIALGHRRLSILDLSSAGHQPMSLGPYTLVYNGEIYNFRRLRDELPGPFRSDSDTEVLLHLYARDGARCLERLEGMFAFAVWDANTRGLFAARDRLGIKPFFYRTTDVGFAFASELKALLVLGEPPIDPGALNDYLTYKYVPTPKTVYRGVSKLPPAHWLELRDGELRTGRYWHPDSEVRERDADRADERLVELLREIVPAHTVADVPLGVFLSGGLDSTTLVSLLEKPRTFTIGFEGSDRSETEQAAKIAEQFGTRHRERVVQAVDLDAALDAMPSMYDEPFGDSAAWSTHVVSREARRDVTVALSGEGGDELFSGYAWHDKQIRYRSSPLARAARRLVDPFSSLGLSLHRRAARGVERYAALTGPFHAAQKKKMLVPGLVESDYDDLWFFRQHWREDLEPVKRMQWLDLHAYLPEDLLVKADRASMAVSLELRPPLLDHRLVEFALSLDGSLLRRDRIGKLPIRRYLRRQVPAEVLSRPKRGFSMPIRKWVASRPELVRGALGRLAREGIVRADVRPDLHSEQIWTLLVLDRWFTQRRSRSGGAG
jgi:asparagine synthase (glutamine-hydrolysing)